MKNYATEIKWGLIFVIVMLLWMVFERMMGWHGESIERHAVMTNLFAIPAIIIYVLALLDKRKKDYSGIMTWKQGFLAGLLITIVVAILTPVAQYLTHTVITPDYFTNIIEYSVNNGEMSRDEAISYFSLNNYIIMSVIGALGMGVVTSAIVAIFTKKSAS